MRTLKVLMGDNYSGNDLPAACGTIPGFAGWMPELAADRFSGLTEYAS